LGIFQAYVCRAQFALYVRARIPIIDQLPGWDGIGPMRYAELRDKLLPFSVADVENYSLTIDGAFNSPTFVKFRGWCNKQGLKDFDELSS